MELTEGFETGYVTLPAVGREKKPGGKQHGQDHLLPAWYNGKHVDHIAYIDSLKAADAIKTINGRLFSMDGLIEDEVMRSRITADLKPYIRRDLSSKVTVILQTLKDDCRAEAAPPRADRIHFANGTWHLEGGFTPEKEWTMNRLPVPFEQEAPKPERWLQFLSELLHPEDIPTLQEYLGYCLIPSTKGQAMLLLIGNGGEGKSRIGAVMKALFGRNMERGDLSALENNRFAAANLEGKLLFVDDELKLAALQSTNTIKAIVTCDDCMEVELKGKQAYQAQMYARLLCFGNGSLRSLYDKTNGFYRRQIILNTRPRPADRIDDPYLTEKLLDELPGIVLWCLEGLQRLLDNRYRFTISERAERAKQELIIEDNTVQAFLEDRHYIAFHPRECATTKMLYDSYCLWCNENGLKPQSITSLCNHLKQNQEQLGLSYSNHVRILGGRPARGFIGIQVLCSGSNPIGSFLRLPGEEFP